MVESELKTGTEYIAKRPGIWVGRIVEVKPHPGADYLFVATVQIPKLDDTIPFAERFGQDTYYTIVFGGNRELQPNDLVPVALPGAVLPNSEKIRSRKWRGIRSEGMLLSSDELGWTIGGPDEVAVLSHLVGEAGEKLTGPSAKVFDYLNAYYLTIKPRSAAIQCYPNIYTERTPGSPIATYRMVTAPSGNTTMIMNEKPLGGSCMLQIRRSQR